MSVSLDGNKLFDEYQLELITESVTRQRIDMVVAGLDGTASIDLGQRGRVIRQRGILRAATVNQLEQKIGDISAYFDGAKHTLVTSDGRTFENLRIDRFESGKRQSAGDHVVCDYEIVYRQLVV